ncbi:hypothetical protein [Streptomyces sennicomposti]
MTRPLGLVDGTVTVCEDGDDTSDAVAFDRDHLPRAPTAAARPALTLEFGTPATLLAVRRPDDEDAFSILMPVRPSGQDDGRT